METIFFRENESLDSSAYERIMLYHVRVLFNRDFWPVFVFYSPLFDLHFSSSPFFRPSSVMIHLKKEKIIHLF